MAHRSRWFDFCQDRVVVAVNKYFHKFKEVAGRFTFCPQPLFASAEEGNAFVGYGFFVGLVVHVPEHEHFPAEGVLYNAGQEAIAVAEGWSLVHGEVDFRTAMPRSSKYDFRSGIRISPKWKMLAANAASALPVTNTSTKCPGTPAPPDAITGILSKL